MGQHGYGVDAQRSCFHRVSRHALTIQGLVMKGRGDSELAGLLDPQEITDTHTVCFCCGDGVFGARVHYLYDSPMYAITTVAPLLVVLGKAPLETNMAY